MDEVTTFIPVVAAVIVREQEVLLCQRKAEPHLPLLWEFPGGKVRSEEEPATALLRELREELGVPARVGPQLAEVHYHYPEKSVWIRFYAAAIDGTPRPLVHRQVRWIPLPELDLYPVPPANAVMVEKIRVDDVPTAEAPRPLTDGDDGEPT